MGSLLSTRGRMSRAGYFWKGLAATALLYAGVFLSFLLTSGAAESEVPLSLWVILGISTLYGGVNTVKRLHDLGRPGWHYWLGYIPFYNFYLGIILTFRAGTPGANAYDDNPVTKPLRVTRAGVGLR